MTASAPASLKHSKGVASCDQAARPPRRERIWITLSLVIVWQLLALVFVEAILYWAGLGEEEIFKLDSKIGFTHMPNKRVTWRSEGYSQSYFDGDGMRDPGLSRRKPQGIYRVALLGDSMVEGLQVPIEQTFGKLIEKRLQTEKSGLGEVQILNFGNSGYSTTQEYLQLRHKVLRYQPDLVLLGYSSRDMLENISRPDQTITNLRPIALPSPKKDLVIDNSPVLKWMQSPRAQYLLKIDWLRQHSRIYGLISAIELQLSYKDPVYRAIIAFLTDPAQTTKELSDGLQHFSVEPLIGPSFGLSFFRTPHLPAPPAHWGAVAQQAVSPQYETLLTRIMGALLNKMQIKCKQHNAHFAVVLMPSRAELIATADLDTEFSHITYKDERDIIKNICLQQNIPVFDTEEASQQLPARKRPGMFYFMHLTPEGHRRLAGYLYPFVRSLIANHQDMISCPLVHRL